MTHQGILITHWLALCLGGWITMCTAGPCDPGWYYRNGTCYHFNSEMKSWNDANDTCTGLNASLVQIKYLELNTYLTVTAATIFTSDYYWIGLKRTDYSEYRNYNENNETSMTWKSGEPNHGVYACIYAMNGLMFDSACYMAAPAHPYGFICQASKSCNDPTLDKSGFASHNRHQYGDNTCLMHYKFSTEHYSWDHCHSSCSSRSGHLVHMTADIDSFLRGKVSNYSSTSFWIAARPYKEDIFYWIDGTLNKMSVTWDAGQPNRLDENCVFMEARRGLWNDSQCQWTKNFICEKEAYPFEPPSTTTSLTTRQTFDCRCRCARLGKNMIVNMTLEQLHHAVNKLKSELAVNKSSLSSVIRRKISAGDQRQSATIVGYIGTAILCVVFGAMIIADLPRLLRILQHLFRKENRPMWFRPKTHPSC